MCERETIFLSVTIAKEEVFLSVSQVKRHTFEFPKKTGKGEKGRKAALRDHRLRTDLRRPGLPSCSNSHSAQREGPWLGDVILRQSAPPGPPLSQGACRQHRCAVRSLQITTSLPTARPPSLPLFLLLPFFLLLLLLSLARAMLRMDRCCKRALRLHLFTPRR